MRATERSARPDGGAAPAKTFEGFDVVAVNAFYPYFGSIPHP
jgi:hypothetical protein